MFTQRALILESHLTNNTQEVSIIKEIIHKRLFCRKVSYIFRNVKRLSIVIAPPTIAIIILLLFAIDLRLKKAITIGITKNKKSQI